MRGDSNESRFLDFVEILPKRSPGQVATFCKEDSESVRILTVVHGPLRDWSHSLAIEGWLSFPFGMSKMAPRGGLGGGTPEPGSHDGCAPPPDLIPYVTEPSVHMYIV